MAQCYRHPDRETNVSCSSCGKPICPSCMTPTSVGMRCPECAGDRTPVRTAASIGSTNASTISVTIGLIAINVIAFLASGQLAAGGVGAGANRVFLDGGLWGPNVANGEYWRLVTSGFLHGGQSSVIFNLLHIGFNMFLLWILGQMLEPALGHWRFLLLYVTALLAGSFGALLLSPHAFTVGASGAVFGLLGAAAVFLWRTGRSVMEAGIGGLIVFNLIFSFTAGGSISIGAHIGGLIGGALGMLAIHEADKRRQPVLGVIGCLAVAAVSVVGAVAAAPTGVLLPA